MPRRNQSRRCQITICNRCLPHTHECVLSGARTNLGLEEHAQEYIEIGLLAMVCRERVARMYQALEGPCCRSGPTRSPQTKQGRGGGAAPKKARALGHQCYTRPVDDRRNTNYADNHAADVDNEDSDADDDNAENDAPADSAAED